MRMDILVGLQWGDEGKGKFIDHICNQYDIVARFNGGANAGHSIYYKNHKVTLKLLPSGVFYSNMVNVIGTGVVVNPIQLKQEIEQLQALDPTLDVQKRLLLSAKAHIVLPTYPYFDRLYEEHPQFRTIGTTKNGIAPAYANKILRQNLRLSDIYQPQFEQDLHAITTRQYKELQQFQCELPAYEVLIEEFLLAVEFLKKLLIVDTELYLNQALKEGKKVLAEGAQATMLDIDHGTYPYVTSSSTIAGGACTGLGVSPTKVGEIFGVTKAYTTRVGEGIFPTELMDTQAEELRNKGGEFGSNTKRPRRVGWLDLPALKYAVMVNGVTQLIVTKGDILSEMEEVPVCIHYEVKGEKQLYFDVNQREQEIQPIYKKMKGWSGSFETIEDDSQLPPAYQAYIDFLSQALEVPVTYLSTGPKREEIIALRESNNKHIV
ncbi:adenylosuccinate synthase [Myroides sp. WP-1]|uniref:adenylosuccinate synthase n=1 Tax=Myroides sp. WP-1 TaxID=2759944 RepID=UPI0015FDE6D9|nr:adenylosuccinate synthase [Myroides sp. WP-1]MBB1137916.1 adenylosuccinate synthase [Myroides sp. WP-1]